MSRRSRARQQVRPWAEWEREEEPQEDPQDDDLGPLYLTTGEPIDMQSAWQMPGMEKQQ